MQTTGQEGKLYIVSLLKAFFTKYKYGKRSPGGGGHFQCMTTKDRHLKSVWVNESENNTGPHQTGAKWGSRPETCSVMTHHSFRQYELR